MNELAKQGMSSAIGGSMDMASQNMNNDAARRQHERNKDMADYMHNKQMDLWNKTNYPAQVEQMRKAGLNIGLMYNGQGQGGQTNAVAGNTSQEMGTNKMENTSRMVSQSMEMSLLEAQKKNIEADTQNKLADAEAKGGYQREEAEARTTNLRELFGNIQADTSNKQADTEIKRVERDWKYLDYEIKNETKDWSIKRVEGEVKLLEEQTEEAVRNNYIGEETKKTAVNIIKQNYLESVARVAAMKSGIKMNDARIGEIAQNIAMGWDNLAQGQQQIKINDFKAKVDAFLGKENATRQETQMYINTFMGILQGNSSTEILSGETPGGDRRTVTKKRF